RQWAAFRVLVASPRIGAYDAETHHVQATEEGHRQDDRCIARHVDVADQSRQENHKPEREGEYNTQDAERGEYADGQVGKREHAVEQVGQLLAERPGAPPVLAGAPVVRHLLPPEADPED